MTRRNPRRTTEDAAPLGTVTVHRRQVVRYAGHFVAEVIEKETGIIVRRKRASGGKYDAHFYPYDRVIAYVAGRGGSRRSDVHALVYDHVLLAQYVGEMSRDDDNTVTVSIIDRDTNEPLQVVIPWRRDDTLVVNASEETDKPRAEAARGANDDTGDEPFDDASEADDPPEGDDGDTYDETEDDPEAGADDDLTPAPEEPAPARGRRPEASAPVSQRGRVRDEAPRGRVPAAASTPRGRTPAAPVARGRALRVPPAKNGAVADDSWFSS